LHTNTAFVRSLGVCAPRDDTEIVCAIFPSSSWLQNRKREIKKSIVLGVTGSIAAYKSAELASFAGETEVTMFLW
jgi:hypothetical protein